MIRTLLMAAAAAVPPVLHAQTAEALPPALAVPLAQGLKVHTSFPGPSGLRGWVLLRNGDEPLIVFTTADGRTALSGAAVDERGRDLVSAYVEAYAPKPDFSSFLPRLADAAAIVQGDRQGSMVLYAFFDPTCPFCNQTYGSVKTALKPDWQVRWIPIDYLSPKSAGLAAALLAADDPGAALDRHEVQFKQGGIEAASVTPTVRQQLDANLRLFSLMGLTGVPAIVYRHPDGRWDIVSGTPRAEDMRKMFGTP